MTQDPSRDEHMREGVDFHTEANPRFTVNKTSRNQGRHPQKAPEDSPWARTMLQPLNPYGSMLNLDVIDFSNIETIIDEWVAAMKISAATLDLDKDNFIRLIELSLEGSAKSGWENLKEKSKAEVIAGESKTAIAERFGRLFKGNFVGDGYYGERGWEKRRQNTQLLYSLELRSICAADEYIYWFRKYFHQSTLEQEQAAPLFFAKICSLWREMLIQSYTVPEEQADNVARIMSFFKEQLGKWCEQSSLQKNKKKLRGKLKKTSLCCVNNDFPTIIGETSKKHKKRRRKDKIPTREEDGGPSPKPGNTNLDKGRATTETRDPTTKGQEIQEGRLSEGPIPEPMKASKTLIVGHVG